MGIGRGNNPNSRANLRPGRYRDYPEEARKSAMATNRKKAERRDAKKILEDNIGEVVEALTKESTFDEFVDASMHGNNQLQRICYREGADQKTAFAFVQWVFDRVCGKSKIISEASVDASLASDKPVIVFREESRKDE